jgi:hypothetical protein
VSDIAERAAGQDEDLDAAIEHARAAVSAVLHAPTGGEGSRLVAKARAALASLLEQRIALTTQRLDDHGRAAVPAARADRDEAIAVTAALLYGLPPGDPAWREVALTAGRLSYDRYRDAWPDAEPPDPDDLDAACDLLLRGARPDEADERTARYLFLALRDRRRLLRSPADSDALVTWGRLLLTFPEAGGLGRGSLHNMLEAELLNRAESRGRAAAWWIPGQRRLAGGGTTGFLACRHGVRPRPAPSHPCGPPGDAPRSMAIASACSPTSMAPSSPYQARASPSRRRLGNSATAIRPVAPRALPVQHRVARVRNHPDPTHTPL